MTTRPLLSLRRLVGAIGRRLNPVYLWCYRCGMPWCWTKGHSTPYVWSDDGNFTMGMFPLCEWCWSRLNSVERLPYYARLLAEWPDARDPSWKQVSKAVLTEQTQRGEP